MVDSSIVESDWTVEIEEGLVYLKPQNQTIPQIFDNIQITASDGSVSVSSQYHTLKLE